MTADTAQTPATVTPPADPWAAIHAARAATDAALARVEACHVRM